MKFDLSLTEAQFKQLLAWLDTDPDRAGEKYEKIRRRLINIFLNRQCHEAEDLADETITRVAKKVSALKDTYTGDPTLYFYGVARVVRKEYFRERSRQPQTPPPETSRDELEPQLRCLDECLKNLSPSSRELVLSYYRERKRAKISSHKEMSKTLGVNAGALRARVHRVRVKLEKCVRECLERAGEGNDIGLVTI